LTHSLYNSPTNFYNAFQSRNAHLGNQNHHMNIFNDRNIDGSGKRGK
jgi:hypothetical protein